MGDNTVKQILALLRALWKYILSSLVFLVVIGLWLTYDILHGVRIMPFLWILLAAWLIINAAMIVLLIFEFKKEAPLNEILAENGYCELYLEKFHEVYPNPNKNTALRLIGILTTMKHYAEAEQMLQQIQPFGLNDDQKMEYHTCRMDLFLSRHRFDAAIAELQSCRRFMDIYANAHPQRGFVYGLNAAVILAAANDYEGSEHYLQAAEHGIGQMKGISPCMAQIAKVMQLSLLGFTDRAGQLAEQTRLAIMEDPVLRADWQKQHFLQKLEDARTYIRE